MPTALIAEDEPLLAAALQNELKAAWPELRVVAMAENGPEALRLATELKPDVLFLDIRMPGQTGLEVAEDLADTLVPGARPPHIVFVTAYDEFALAAFERAAVDYVLKPVTPERLQKTVARLKERLAASGEKPEMDRLLDQLRQLVPAGAGVATGHAVSSGTLRHIHAGSGNTVKLIPVESVCYLQATDKYVNVVSADGEALVRLSLKELLAQLPAGRFQQVHRGTVVNLDAVSAAVRDDSGRVKLKLRNRTETLQVSRVYADLFKAM